MSLLFATSAQPRKRSGVIADALATRNENQQWEEFIVAMLKKLELSPEKQEAAKRRYEQFGHHVARKLGIGDDDAHVVVQGSMRTQTTIAGDGREKFDLDVVVKLKGPKFDGLRESEPFFQQFGAALEGLDGAGLPEAKNRCWRLQYPGEPFYFDVTPAIPLGPQIEGTLLRVRDEVKIWSPSNPEKFADWFCNIANKRFPFQERMKTAVADARTVVDPIPHGKVGFDDILRRLVQLMKLHRDSYYKRQAQYRQEAKPISVILVTLAAWAYDELCSREANSYSSSIEVVLEVVERMPNFIRRGWQAISVDNPVLSGTVGENFADKWNSDEGLRDREFSTWHERLTLDLEALFSEEYSKRSENRVQAVFGDLGVKAWKDNQPTGVLAGLLATAPVRSALQPSAPRRSAPAANTLA